MTQETRKKRRKGKWYETLKACADLIARGKTPQQIRRHMVKVAKKVPPNQNVQFYNALIQHMRRHGLTPPRRRPDYSALHPLVDHLLMTRHAATAITTWLVHARHLPTLEQAYQLTKRRLRLLQGRCLLIRLDIFRRITAADLPPPPAPLPTGENVEVDFSCD